MWQHCLQRLRQSHSARRHFLQMLQMCLPDLPQTMPGGQRRTFRPAVQMRTVRQSRHRQRRNRPEWQKLPLIRHRKRSRRQVLRHSLQLEVPKVPPLQHKQRVSMQAMQLYLKPQRVKAPSRLHRLQNRVITAQQLQH